MLCYSSLFPKEIERNAGWRGWGWEKEGTRFPSSKPLHQGVLSIEQTEVWRDHLLKALMGCEHLRSTASLGAGNLPGHLLSQLREAQAGL